MQSSARRGFLAGFVVLSFVVFATSRVSAVEVLGVGTVFLVGNDLTDLGDDGDQFAYLPPELGGFDAIFFSSDEPGFEGAEAAYNVFDNLLGPGNDKWCCGTVFPQIVGADFTDTLEDAFLLTSFTVSSANDTPERDPVVWRIEGSNDGECWITIFGEDDLANAVDALALPPGSPIWTDRLQVVRFEADVDYPFPEDAFTMFRMVTFQTGLAAGAFFQIGEIEFFGEPSDPPKDPPEDCPTCSAAVENIECSFGPVGLGQGLNVSWTIPENCGCLGNTAILLDGVEVGSVAPEVTSFGILQGALPPGAFSVEVRNCSGLSASCSPFKTDDRGFILSREWMTFGAIANLNACVSHEASLGNHIWPNFIQCEYPALGDELSDEVDFLAPENVADGFHVSVPNPPVWRPFQDATPTNGDLDMVQDVAGDLDAHMMFVSTWVTYSGPATSIRLCVGSDDGVQVWLNERLALNNNVCRGRDAVGLPCVDNPIIDNFEPGTYRITMGVWEMGGGWGGYLALQDEFGTPIVDGDPNWTFHGTERPDDFEIPECAAENQCEPVSNLVCVRDIDDFTIELTWDNPAGCESEIEIRGNGELIATLEAETNSFAIDPAEFPMVRSVTVSNGALTFAQCSLVEVLFELFGDDLTDLGNDGVETLYFPPGDLGGFDAIFFSSDEPGFEGVEGAYNVFDNIVAGGGNNKWCCGTAFPQIVGADFTETHEAAFRLTHFTIASANDTPGRDPRVWRIEGSNDGIEWTTIFEQNDPDVSLWAPEQRDTILRFEEGRDFPVQEDAYTMFRFVADATGLVGGAFFQISELEFFGEEGDIEPPVDGFVRGDSDSSGTINLADGIQVLNFLFLGNAAPACLDAADTDNSGRLLLNDGVVIFNYLFSGGPPPVEPSPSAANYLPGDCGPDSGASLGCATIAAKCT